MDWQVQIASIYSLDHPISPTKLTVQPPATTKHHLANSAFKLKNKGTSNNQEVKYKTNFISLRTTNYASTTFRRYSKETRHWILHATYPTLQDLKQDRKEIIVLLNTNSPNAWTCTHSNNRCHQMSALPWLPCIMSSLSWALQHSHCPAESCITPSLLDSNPPVCLDHLHLFSPKGMLTL